MSSRTRAEATSSQQFETRQRGDRGCAGPLRSAKTDNYGGRTSTDGRRCRPPGETFDVPQGQYSMARTEPQMSFSAVGHGSRAGVTRGGGRTVSADDWHRVEQVDVPDEGRVRSVVVDGRTVALARCGGRLGALENRCPHQGGPLGEGSIENGWLRCPWHGYDYDPLTGRPPEGFADGAASFAVEERTDGVYVRLPALARPERTVADVLVETLICFGVTHVFGMVGHSNLGFADAMRRAEQRGELTYVGIRHEGAAAFAASAYGKLTGRPAACFAIAGPGSTNLLTGLYDAKVDRAPVLAISGQVPSKVLGRGAFQDLDLTAVFSDVASFSQTLLPGSDHAELMTLALKEALIGRHVGHVILPDEVQVQPAEGARAGAPRGRIAASAVLPPPGSVADAV